jgi:glycosyltransferase involved in cell wall biosynthesis
VSRVKGILDLLDAWAKVNNSEWELLVIGPVDDDISNEFHEKLDVCNAQFKGAVYGNDRFDFFDVSDAFILPSYAEGLPTALLEAAAGSNTIIYTPECNFNQLEAVKGGLIIDTGQESISNGLDRLFVMNDGELNRFSTIAKDLVIQEFSWKSIVEKHIRLYKGN